ncbi:hypothetical protein SERLADRAFT_448603 [Serpula lacrymans var. lacrymans S7.9]|uniref:Zinc-finger domain-containing protein n=1 Tax=Serpula lacrymans var. lacrymans (strain S7.9) TaxID=578457 RepID=F8NTH0_SERL9|nr:uncharacterized protein SERLADRAFT_448603 [Serpula lacrymans var. lacrymans S7.9]EGO25642.1 hypothetical protein SERLADRAFT_448603 [Serpula lacrymans var. lacrymans S7.9]
MATKKADKHIFRRLSQVYVEIPPSPLHRSRNASISAPHVSSVNQSRKENALLPLANSQMTHNQPSNSHKKRKRDTEESSDMTLVDNSQPIKKSKSSGTKGPTAAGESIKPKVSDEFPDGYHYCHQCYRKRDQSAIIRCTFKVTKEQSCGAKYCKPCLKNRYGLDFDAIKAKGEIAKSKERSKHAVGQGHIFKCPRCNDSCNCVRCRKAKGLRPTGASGKKSKDPAAARKTETKKPRAAPRPKLLPKPVWTGVPISLSLSDAEDRFHIREFVLRFASALGVSRTHVEELEEIQGFRGRGSEDDDDDLVAWVSEPCVKSIILGLLGMLDLDGEAAKSTDAAIKEIRHSGANLNKLWAELSSLRDGWSRTIAISSSSASSGKRLTFPDPLPPPESATVHQTRSGAAQVNATGVNVVRTAQLVPILHALVDAVIDTDAVREELDSGLQEAKERAREAREGLKRENERFEQEKQDEDKKDKSKLRRHKRMAADIEQVLKLSTYAYAPRLSPLGRDHEGRTYWALSPGLVETEAALDTLSSVSQGKTASRKARGRKRMVPSEEHRSSLRKWSWFIGVWGMLPPPEERKIIRDSEDDISDDSVDEEGEQWWAFWNPEEISKLATWIAYKAGLSEKESRPNEDDRNTHSGIPLVESSVNGEEVDDSPDEDDNENDDCMDSTRMPTRGQLKMLIKGLQEYSALLKWRTSRDEEDHKIALGDS